MLPKARLGMKSWPWPASPLCHQSLCFSWPSATSYRALPAAVSKVNRGYIMAEVIFSKLGKVYSNGFRAVHGIDLTIRDGEFMVIVGPSGCAKSTTLRMLAGLETISDGEVRIGERV